MSDSSDDDFQPEQTATGRSSTKDGASEASGTANDTESEDGEGNTSEDIPVAEKVAPKRALRIWQVLAEYSREEYDSEEIDENIVQLAKDEISTKLSTTAYRHLSLKKEKQKEKGTSLDVWQLRSEREVKHPETNIKEFYCPYRVRAGCQVCLRVARTSSQVCVSIAGNHSLASHEEKNTKYLTLTQRGEIAKLVRAQPVSHSGEIRRQLQESSPAKKVSHKQRRSVARAVRAQQRLVVEGASDTIVLDPTFGSLHSLSETLFLPSLLKR